MIALNSEACVLYGGQAAEFIESSRLKTKIEHDKLIGEPKSDSNYAEEITESECYSRLVAQFRLKSIPFSTENKL